jgi:hypothetical protein
MGRDGFKELAVWQQRLMSAILIRSRLDFSIAKGPLAELRPQLQIAFEIGHIERDTFKSLDRECRQLGKMIGALIKAGNNMPAYSRLPLASRLF